MIFRRKSTEPLRLKRDFRSARPGCQAWKFLFPEESRRFGREGKRTQVWLLPRCGGEAVKLTDFKTGVSDIVWSPDSKRLALVMKDADPDGAGSGDDEILAQVDFDGPDY